MMPPIDPAKCRQKIQASGGTSESLYCRFFILHNIVCLLLIRSVFRFTCRICPRYLSKRQIFSFVMTVLRQRPSEHYTLNLAGMLRQFDEVHFLQPQLPFFSCYKNRIRLKRWITDGSLSQSGFFSSLIWIPLPDVRKSIISCSYPNQLIIFF